MTRLIDCTKRLKRWRRGYERAELPVVRIWDLERQGLPDVRRKRKERAMSDDGYPYDDEDCEDESERCPECGAWPEEYHEMDCTIGDDEAEEDAADCESVYHPGCTRREVRP